VSFARDRLVLRGKAQDLRLNGPGCFRRLHAVKSSDQVRWPTAESRWTHKHDDRTFVFKPHQGLPAATEPRSAAQSGEWRKTFGVVIVPPDVGKLVILLNVTGQVADSDVCWFHNLILYRLR